MELGRPQESRVRSHSAVGAMRPEPSSDPWGPRLCYREGQVGLLSRYSMQLPLRGLATPPGGTPEMVASEGGRPSAPEQVSKRVSGQVSAGDECTAARDKMGSSCVGPCPEQPPLPFSALLAGGQAGTSGRIGDILSPGCLLTASVLTLGCFAGSVSQPAAKQNPHS